MDIAQAKIETDWKQASEILCRVANFLCEKNEALWEIDQVFSEQLKNSYQLDELHFVVSGSERVGVVFLQESDPLFWPEVADRDSLYIHKLAIDPPYISLGYSKQALQAIFREAEIRKLNWLRLDCDDRKSLHRFYQDFGFQRVDFKQVGIFKAVRYQLPTNYRQAPTKSAHLL